MTAYQYLMETLLGPSLAVPDKLEYFNVFQKQAKIILNYQSGDFPARCELLDGKKVQ